MKKLIFSLAFLSLITTGASADLVLATDYSPGTPLMMSAGTTSGPMLVSAVSDNPPNDMMAAWNILLMIVPDPGASGTLTFQDPSDSMSSPPPSSYVFGSNGLGITVTNSGNMLSAFDYLDPSFALGVSIPGSPGAILLQMDFLASSNASGLFGIYAVEGVAGTQWTDANAITQLFTNVPDGTGLVRIGDVLIPQSVPEPSSVGLLGLAGAVLAGWRCWNRRKCGL